MTAKNMEVRQPIVADIQSISSHQLREFRAANIPGTGFCLSIQLSDHLSGLSLVNDYEEAKRLISQVAECVNHRSLRRLQILGDTNCLTDSDTLKQLAWLLRRHFQVLADDLGRYQFEVKEPLDAYNYPLILIREMGFNELRFNQHETSDIHQIALLTNNAHQLGFGNIELVLHSGADISGWPAKFQPQAVLAEASEQQEVLVSKGYRSAMNNWFYKERSIYGQFARSGVLLNNCNGLCSSNETDILKLTIHGETVSQRFSISDLSNY